MPPPDGGEHPALELDDDLEPVWVSKTRITATLAAMLLTFLSAPFFRPSLLMFVIWCIALEIIYVIAWEIVKRHEFIRSKIARDFHTDQPDYPLYRLIAFACIFLIWLITHSAMGRTFTVI